MDVVRFGLGLRALRRRRNWTQQELARRVGVSRGLIARVERGGGDRITVRVLDRIGAALGARIDVRLLWQGEALDRLLDAGHAELVEHIVELLARWGWLVRLEATFNHAGDRGSIDVLGWHPGTGAVVVIEVKPVVPDIQAMLAALDRKCRVARTVAGTFGWRATSVSRVVVLPDDRTARRRVATHASTFATALPPRTVAVRRWLQRPAGHISGLMFLSSATRACARHRVARPRRTMRRGTALERRTDRAEDRADGLIDGQLTELG